MKHTTLFLASLLALGSAIARAGTEAPAAPLSFEAAGKASGVPGVNPFTGKPLQLERVMRELEESRLRTALLEEELKQTNLREETTTVPLRKAVEAAQARNNVLKEEAGARASLAATNAARAAQSSAAAASPKAPTKKAAAKAAAKEAELRIELEAKVRAEMTAREKVVPVVPPVRLPTLLSVLSIDDKKSVVLDFGGAGLTLADGAMSPAGIVRVTGAASATVGGAPIHVHSATLSRFVLSDTNAAEPKPAKAAVVAAAPVPTLSTTAALGAAMAMPPLQLPPGLPPLPGSPMGKQ